MNPVQWDIDQDLARDFKVWLKFQSWRCGNLLTLKRVLKTSM